MVMADLSVEFAHLYLANLDEEQAGKSAKAAARWLAPTIAAYENAGRTVSTVVMVDDYFAPDDTDIEAKAEILRAACSEANLRVDHLAYESACAESVERMQALLHSEPRSGDGSSSPPTVDIGSDWLTNGDPPRGRQREPAVMGRLHLVDKNAPPKHEAITTQARGHHSIHLDVQLWKKQRGSIDKLWACPTLAAWWQLVRLGMLRDKDDRPSAPPRTKSQADGPPLPARRTITLLDNRFLEVEHAVQAILSRLSLPDAWRRYLREGATPPGPYEHLERIAYLFVPGGFGAPPE